MNFGGIGTVSAITVICYLICELVKTTKLDNKFVPVIAGLLGGILGVVGYMIQMPDFPANDILTAIAVGIVSGLAATGVNQIGKQMKKDEPPKEPKESEHNQGTDGSEV